PEHTDARWAEKLVPGKGVEVAVESLHVHRLMGYALGTVDQHQGIMGPRHATDLGNRVHRSQCIGNVGQCHQPCAFIEALPESLEVQLAVVEDRCDHQSCASALA